jgi:hypothetical protein
LTPHFSDDELGGKMYSDTGGIRVPTSKNLSGKKSLAYGKTAYEM